MILILSTNEQDNETDLVCKSLIYCEVDFLRVNVDDFHLGNVYVSEAFFVVGGTKYRFQDFDLVWIRRSIANFNGMFHNNAFDAKSNLRINLYNFQEWNLFLKFLFLQFPKERMVNQAAGYFADKIDQLMLAREIGLAVPESLFSNNANDLQQYESREIISKPAGNLGYLQRRGRTVKAYTELVAPETLPSHFLPAFFQEKLEATYEIRTLYLDGDFFNCGLIKARNSSHPVDVKNQDGLRCQPVSLPAPFSAKIREFMKRIGFQIGFVDILKTASGYQFIEMNPYGKFLYYSHSCNFNFEHRIANFLMHEANRKK